MAAPAETVPESVAAPEKEVEKKEESSKPDESSKPEEKEVQKDAGEEKNGHIDAEDAKKNSEYVNGEGDDQAKKNGTSDKKANGLPPAEEKESETDAVSDACPVKRKSEAADIPDTKVSEEDSISCEKKAKIEEKLAAAKGEEVPKSDEAETTA